MDLGWKIYVILSFSVYDMDKCNCKDLENPSLIELGYPLSTATSIFPLSDPEGNRLLIPNPDVTFPSDGKLLNVSFWFSAKANPKVKVVSLTKALVGSVITYRPSSISQESHGFSNGWNTVTFENDDDYLRVRSGDTLALVFDSSDNMAYQVYQIGSPACPLSSGSFHYIDVGFDSKTFAEGQTLPPLDVIDTAECRDYLYHANYIPDNTCLNITLPANRHHSDRGYRISTRLHSDLQDSMCWNVKAPPKGDGEDAVVAMTIVAYSLGQLADDKRSCIGAELKLIDGNGRELDTFCDANTRYGRDSTSALYSITTNMIVRLTSDSNNKNTMLVAYLVAIRKKDVPASYYYTYNPEKNSVSLIVGIVVPLLLVGSIGYVMWQILSRKKEARVNAAKRKARKDTQPATAKVNPKQNLKIKAKAKVKPGAPSPQPIPKPIAVPTPAPPPNNYPPMGGTDPVYPPIAGGPPPTGVYEGYPPPNMPSYPPINPAYPP